MDRKNTALLNCFVRAFHYKNCRHRIFSDEYADKLLGNDYGKISEAITKNQDPYPTRFEGKPYEILRYKVDHCLASFELTRSAFCQRLLDNAVMLGCTQYFFFSSGYNSFSLRNSHKHLKIFEIDTEDILFDKQKRVTSLSGSEKDPSVYIPCNKTEDFTFELLTDKDFDKNKLSFAGLMGLSNELNKEGFSELIRKISAAFCKGSSIVFDYTSYTYEEMERMLSLHGFLIYEHLSSTEIDEQYLYNYNILNVRHQIKAPVGLNLCLAVKRR